MILLIKNTMKLINTHKNLLKTNVVNEILVDDIIKNFNNENYLKIKI